MSTPNAHGDHPAPSHGEKPREASNLSPAAAPPPTEPGNSPHHTALSPRGARWRIRTQGPGLRHISLPSAGKRSAHRAEPTMTKIPNASSRTWPGEPAAAGVGSSSPEGQCPPHSPRQGLPVRVHPAEDEDARQALQLQVRLGSPLRFLDLLPHLPIIEEKQSLRLLTAQRVRPRAPSRPPTASFREEASALYCR